MKNLTIVKNNNVYGFSFIGIRKLAQLKHHKSYSLLYKKDREEIPKKQTPKAKKISKRRHFESMQEKKYLTKLYLMTDKNQELWTLNKFGQNNKTNKEKTLR